MGAVAVGQLVDVDRFVHAAGLALGGGVAFGDQVFRSRFCSAICTQVLPGGGFQAQVLSAACGHALLCLPPRSARSWGLKILQRLRHTPVVPYTPTSRGCTISGHGPVAPVVVEMKL